MKITHYRHATSIIELDNKKILIDPLFAKAGTYPAIIYSNNNRKNPLVNLPIDYTNLFNVDGVIITHNHNDHFDELAKKVLPKDLPILCQNEDLELFKGLGFSQLTAISNKTQWLGFNCSRFIGTHGGGFLKSKLGITSSYLLESKEGRLYLTGDTLLTTNVKKIVRYSKPNWVLANGGAAKMKILGQITMGNKHIIKLCQILPDSKIIAVHMDSINHCGDTQDKLKSLVNGVNNIVIPYDGEIINLP